MGVTIPACNADAVALTVNNPRVAKRVPPGFGSSRKHFFFSDEEVRDVTEILSGSKNRTVNLDAREHGRSL